MDRRCKVENRRSNGEMYIRIRRMWKRTRKDLSRSLSYSKKLYAAAYAAKDDSAVKFYEKMIVDTLSTDRAIASLLHAFSADNSSRKERRTTNAKAMAARIVPCPADAVPLQCELESKLKHDYE